ncbi:MAG: hypothetical protein D3925_00970 [Candidatus Electrothrix sp. AR5]|nr:hypothetical protein [Candidatus Electrothrix sp. AR5]
MLWAGAIFLLTKSSRFITEYFLLTLPSLKYIPSFENNPREQKTISATALILISLLIVFHFRYLTLSNQPKFPFSTKKLPVGVATFLNHININGRIFNNANTGGYLQWALGPNYDIYMDMEVPFLFTDKDFFIGKHALSNNATFSKVINHYQPDFLTIKWKEKIYKSYQERIQENFSDYAIIFFDDEEVLYINRKKHPEIFKKYKFQSITPLFLSDFTPDDIPQNTLDEFLSDLKSYNEIYAHCSIVNRAIGKIFISNGEYGKALHHAKMIIKDFPESPEGYLLEADTFLKKEAYKKALNAYKITLTRMGSSGKIQLYERLWKCYYNLKLYKEAYSLLKDTVNIYSRTTSYKDLYRFSITALSTGKNSDSKMLAELALFKVPDNDPVWKQRILSLLAKFQPAHS